MTRYIQSIERAAAVLRVLGAAPHDLALQEVAESLGLAKPTVHGILATLRHVGMVDQDRRTGRYRLARSGTGVPRGGLDPHLLRSHAMNWADTLAATTGAAVLLGVPREQRRGGRPPRVLPGRLRRRRCCTASGCRRTPPRSARCCWQAPSGGSSGCGRHAAGSSPSATPFAPSSTPSCSGCTSTEVRRAGHALEVAEHQPEVAGVAAPIRAFGGLGVGALGVVGPVHRLLLDERRARPEVVEGVVAAAHAVSEQLEQPR